MSNIFTLDSLTSSIKAVQGTAIPDYMLPSDCVMISKVHPKAVIMPNTEEFAVIHDKQKVAAYPVLDGIIFQAIIKAHCYDGKYTGSVKNNLVCEGNALDYGLVQEGFGGALPSPVWHQSITPTGNCRTCKMHNARNFSDKEPRCRAHFFAAMLTFQHPVPIIMQMSIKAAKQSFRPWMALRNKHNDWGSQVVSLSLRPDGNSNVVEVAELGVVDPEFIVTYHDKLRFVAEQLSAYRVVKPQEAAAPSVPPVPQTEPTVSQSQQVTPAAIAAPAMPVMSGLGIGGQQYSFTPTGIK